MLGPSYPYKGGIPQYTTDLFRSLNQRNDVIFFTFKRQYPGWLYPGKSDVDMSATSLQEPTAQPIFDSLNPYTWWQTARIISEFEPDVLILPWWNSFWAPQFAATIWMIRRRRADIKLVFICHNVIAHESNWITRLVTRQVLSMGDAFLVHSESDRKQLEEQLDKPRVEMAELPIYDVGVPGTKADARSALQVEGPTLLFFGFIRPYKGLDILIRAMPEVLANLECTLLVAGEFWKDMSTYQSLVSKLGLSARVRLENRYVPQTEVANYFLASDIVVLPYLSATGSGIAKLAYSFGRPVIVSDVGSLPGSVLEGVNGYVVPPGCPHSLAITITRHFQADRQAEMEQSAAILGKKFSWENLTAKLEAFIEEHPPRADEFGTN